jgi:DNA-binding NarL/FixJ family response regulator
MVCTYCRPTTVSAERTSHEEVLWRLVVALLAEPSSHPEIVRALGALGGRFAGPPDGVRVERCVEFRLAAVGVEALLTVGRIGDATALYEVMAPAAFDDDPTIALAARRARLRLAVTARLGRGDVRSAMDAVEAALIDHRVDVLERAMGAIDVATAWEGLRVAEHAHRWVAVARHSFAEAGLDAWTARLDKKSSVLASRLPHEVSTRDGAMKDRRRDDRRDKKPQAWEGKLSPAQRRIVDLAAAGLTDGEIADQLYLSKRTVSFHLGNIYRRLEVAGRAELAFLVGRTSGT